MNTFGHLFLLGFPKCGTTSLANRLNLAPNIALGRAKETRFFYDRVWGTSGAARSAHDAYLANWPDGARRPGQWLLDASPDHVIGGRACAEAIEAEVAGRPARFIVIVRRPKDRIYSAYRFSRGLGLIPKQATFAEFVEHCLEQRGNDPRTLGTDHEYFHVEATRYSHFLRDWTAKFTPTELAIIDADRLRTDMDTVAREVLECLIGSETALGIGHRTQRVQAHNATIDPTNTWLHGQLARGNLLLEPIWRRAPRFKFALKELYGGLNARGPAPSRDLPEHLARAVEDLEVEERSYLLTEARHHTRPSWLSTWTIAT